MTVSEFHWESETAIVEILYGHHWACDTGIAEMGGEMLDDDGHPHRSPPPQLPHLGPRRHFSWSILDDLDVEEDRRRATSGVNLFGVRDGLLTAEEECELGRRVRAGTNEATEQRDDDARAAIEQLVLANLRLCIRPARSRTRRGPEFDDLVQEGFRGLIRAAQKFDPEQGTRFSTYAMFWIRQAMDRGGDNSARTIRLPVHVVDLQRRIEVAQRKGLIDDRMTHEEVARIVRSDAAHVRVARDAAHEFLGPPEAEAELGARRALDPRALEPDPDDPEAPGWDELTTADEPPLAADTLIALVEDVLDRLSIRESEVIKLYFGLDDLPSETLESIGELFGLTRERVRQIRNEALDSIRRAVAVERARREDFDEEMGLSGTAVRTLTSSDMMLHVSSELSGSEPEVAPRLAPPPPEDPKAARRRVVKSVLSDLRDVTATWSSELLFEPNPEHRQHPRIAERIKPLMEQEPYDRSQLLEALTELVDEVGPDTIGEDLMDMARSAVLEALEVPPPDADGLARLLRRVRFLGCSPDPVAFRLALIAQKRGWMTLRNESWVTSTWHYDEDDPEHVKLRKELRKHGDEFELDWNENFRKGLDLVIAQSFEHRSAKTYAAMLAGVPICDIESFLDHRPGRRLKVLRAPFPIPWTVVCRSCHLVFSSPRSPGGSSPTRCEDCAT